ncbi:hypothetical protein K2X85_12525 [bacterium]|nr:hypothetical protein [bacterium]
MNSIPGRSDNSRKTRVKMVLIAGSARQRLISLWTSCFPGDASSSALFLGLAGAQDIPLLMGPTRED